MAKREKKIEPKVETDLSSYLSEGFSDAPVIEPKQETKPVEGVVNIFPTMEPNPTEKEKRSYTKRKKKDDEDGDPIIDGEMLVEFIDIFIPALISMIHNNFVKDGVKISPDELDATEKQKAKMIKFANRVAEKLNMDVNPFVGLGVTMIGCYGMKYFQAKNK